MTEQPNETAPRGNVCVVDDEPSARLLMTRWLERAGFRVDAYEGAGAALASDGRSYEAACVDLGLDDMSGIDLIKHLTARQPGLSTVVVTADTELDTAVAAMRAGAYDYVPKPLTPERLVSAVERAAERSRLITQVSRLSSELEETRVLGSVVGTSEPMKRLAHQVGRVLGSSVPVCIFGESGTGKELVARAVHEGSPRSAGPFVAVNCASIPESLQESELFGHERGAFTGATATRRGRFEQATGGTLFLDEVGEMSPATQAALLRTLQERTIRRVGGAQEIPIDCRIVCATHRDLAKEVEAGRFREDLYFRLVVYPVELPPLRQRASDISLLVAHFMKQLGDDVGHPVTRVAADAIEALMSHDWPGNVRELRNVVHRAMLSCDGEELQLRHLPPSLRDKALPTAPPPPSAPEQASPAAGGVPFQVAIEQEEILDLREIEKRAIARALRKAEGNVSKAAKLLGIGRATIYRKLNALDLDQAAE